MAGNRLTTRQDEINRLTGNAALDSFNKNIPRWKTDRKPEELGQGWNDIGSFIADEVGTLTPSNMKNSLRDFATGKNSLSPFDFNKGGLAAKSGESLLNLINFEKAENAERYGAENVRPAVKDFLSFVWSGIKNIGKNPFTDVVKGALFGADKQPPAPVNESDLYNLPQPQAIETPDATKPTFINTPSTVAKAKAASASTTGIAGTPAKAEDKSNIEKIKTFTKFDNYIPEQKMDRGERLLHWGNILGGTAEAIDRGIPDSTNLDRAYDALLGTHKQNRDERNAANLYNRGDLRDWEKLEYGVTKDEQDHAAKIMKLFNDIQAKQQDDSLKRQELALKAYKTDAEVGKLGAQTEQIRAEIGNALDRIQERQTRMTPTEIQRYRDAINQELLTPGMWGIFKRLFVSDPKIDMKQAYDRLMREKATLGKLFDYQGNEGARNILEYGSDY